MHTTCSFLSKIFIYIYTYICVYIYIYIYHIVFLPNRSISRHAWLQVFLYTGPLDTARMIFVPNWAAGWSDPRFPARGGNDIRTESGGLDRTKRACLAGRCHPCSPRRSLQALMLPGWLLVSVSCVATFTEVLLLVLWEQAHRVREESFQAAKASAA